jgi:hypothetical protein
MGSGAEKQLLCWLSKDYRLGLVACSLYKPKPVISCIRKAHQSTGPRTDGVTYGHTWYAHTQPATTIVAHPMI